VLWNMEGPRALVLDRQGSLFAAAAFARAGEVLTVSDDGKLRKYVLSPTARKKIPVIWSLSGASVGGDLEVSSDGRFAIVVDRFSAIVFAIPFDGSGATVHELKRDPGEELWSLHPSLDPGGRFVAVPVCDPGDPSKNELRILDLVTGDERSLDTQPVNGRGCEEPGSFNQGRAGAVWLPDGRLISDGDVGLLLWEIDSGRSQLVSPCAKGHPSRGLELLATPDSRKVLRFVPAPKEGEISSLSVIDLATGTTNEITAHGNRLVTCDLDKSGRVLVTVDRSGVIQVGALGGGDPHLLFGHEEPPWGIAISPDGRWLVSTGGDGTTRLWPMPDLSKPPLHTLPREELIAKLKTLTNLRVVRDPDSATGWKLDVGPFPGWETVPTW
jgi:WD40 repeat protein